jgi:hypothetical protein
MIGRTPVIIGSLSGFARVNYVRPKVGIGRLRSCLNSLQKLSTLLLTLQQLAIMHASPHLDN